MSNNFDRFLGKEDWEHIAIIQYLQKNHADKIFFHINSESRKSAFERFKYVKMGKMKGLPDIAILYPKYSAEQTDSSGARYRNLIYMALFLEIKTPEHNRVVLKGKQAGKVVKSKGKASPEQLQVVEKLNSLKYKACICYGAGDAIQIIKEYFSNT